MLKRIVHERETSANIPQGPYNLLSLRKLIFLLYLVHTSGGSSLSMIIKQITVVLHNLPGNNICFLLKPEKTSDLCMYCFLVVVEASSRGLNLVSILVFPTTISNTVFLIYQCKEEFWGNKQEHPGCLLRLLPSSSPNVRKLRTDRLRS